MAGEDTAPDRPVSARGRPRDPEADAAILRAAFDLFLERGVEGTSIEQVAKRAGVGKLTVYRRWQSKEDLLARAIELIVEDRDWSWEADLTTTTPAEIIERNLPVAAETTTNPRFRALVARVYGSAVSHPALLATYWRHYILPRRRSTAAFVESAIDAGTIQPDVDVDVLIDMMAGAITYRVLQPDPPDATEMLRYLRAVYHQAGLLP
jgi:AcrR family transcriptional regulator